MDVNIRDATLADAEAIIAGNVQMALESEGRELDPDTVGAGVRAILADRERGRYWVAKSAGSVVGQIMVTTEWSDWRNAEMWWIQSVYVAEAARRRGVFRRLYAHVEALARSTPGCGGLRLYVEEHNDVARQTYRSLGMAAPGYVVMEADFTA